MKDENVHTVASSSMMPPLPAVCIASSKILAPNGPAPLPTLPASDFPAGFSGCSISHVSFSGHGGVGVAAMTAGPFYSVSCQ
eukprot:5872060-Ditylum_brightwellii.AAC.1